MTLNSKQNQSVPSVSIVILTFNGSDYIAPLLESLRDQSYPRDRTEIIVVDNASTDNTPDIVLNNYPSVKIVQLEENIGFAAGNNQGLLHARHALIVFLNQDTVCHTDFLKSLVNHMLTDRSIAACNPNIITPQTENFGDIENKPPRESLFICDLSPFGYGRNRVINAKAIFNTKLLSGCAFMIRQETVSKLDCLFDDRLWMYAEDTDLSLRLHHLGQRICAAQDAIVYHLHNSNTGLKKSSLRLAARAIMNRVYAYFKNMGSLEFLLFFPLMFLGGNFKILEFPLSNFRKIVYFIPFSLFSMSCMILAIAGLPKFASKKRRAVTKRRAGGFPILKLLLTRDR